MDHDLEAVQMLIKQGNFDGARDRLRPILLQQPSADAWYLAAQVAHSDAQAIQFLREALDLQPFHTAANRDLLRREGAVPTAASKPPLRHIQPPTPKTLPTERQHRLTSTERKIRRNQGLTRLVLLFTLLLTISCGVFTLNAIGIIQGLVSTVTVATGGPTPVLEIEQLPLASVPDAPRIVPASQSEAAQQRDTDVLEHGYLHEYTFDAGWGEEVVLYVQFLSFAANYVSRNVAVIEPGGADITETCSRDAILQDGDNNIVLTCRIQNAGTHRLRILGRDGESVGAYFVGVDRLR
jgi:hypothetical protein